MRQYGIACHMFLTDFNNAFPRGNIGSWGNDRGSWMFQLLPYMEQQALYTQATAVVRNNIPYSDVRWSMAFASLPNPPFSNTGAPTVAVLPKKLPYGRCPSDGFDADNPRYSNYAGSQGPQCNEGNCGADIFQLNCNGRIGTGPNGIPPALATLTHPGYGPSAIHGTTSDASACRGMFCRGAGVIGGPRIRISDVSDGTSNTILLGEILMGQAEFYRYGNGWGWAGYNSCSQAQTIQPINWPIDENDGGRTTYTSCAVNCPGINPANCLWNWHVTWGFKSRHAGGVNFCWGDGSVRFVQQGIDMRTYQYLGCRNDSMPVELP
jgi:prepilin-type processing-associated H-X9-DG protein